MMHTHAGARVCTHIEGGSAVVLLSDDSKVNIVISIFYAYCAAAANISVMLQRYGTAPRRAAPRRDTSRKSRNKIFNGAKFIRFISKSISYELLQGSFSISRTFVITNIRVLIIRRGRLGVRVPGSTSEEIISDDRLDEYLLGDTLGNRQHYSALSLQIFGRKYLRCDEAVKIILSAPGLRGLMVIVTERSILGAPFFAPFLVPFPNRSHRFPALCAPGAAVIAACTPSASRVIALLSRSGILPLVFGRAKRSEHGGVADRDTQGGIIFRDRETRT